VAQISVERRKVMEKFWELVQPYYPMFVRQVIVAGYQQIALGVILLVMALVCVVVVVKLKDKVEDEYELLFFPVVGVFIFTIVGCLVLFGGFARIANPEYYVPGQLFEFLRWLLPS
jgi:hypothetical protein